MVLSEMKSFLGCFSKPFRKKSKARTKCAPVFPLSTEAAPVKPVEESESEYDIKAHLLLRLLGGECHGAVSSSTCEMETELWSMLPEELLPRVLLFLPFISKLRLQAVCKEWQYLLLSSEYSKEISGPLLTPKTPLVCAYRFIHGNLLRDRGAHMSKAPVSLESVQLDRKLKCRQVPLLFPNINPPDSPSRGPACRINAKVSAGDGLLAIEMWKERQLPHGTLRRHRGVPTVLDLFTFIVNPITDSVLSLPQLRTEGDHSLGRNVGLVSTKVVLKAGKGRFDTFSFYWTSWWLDVGLGLRHNTSWFTRVRRHPIEAGRYPESVNVMDRSGGRNQTGVGRIELEAGKFQSVISDGVIFGVHYLPDGSNRLFTRFIHASPVMEWSQWHNEASVPKVKDAVDVNFFLVEHRVSLSVFYVGQSCHKSGKLTFRICRLQPDCYPKWFWVPITVMPSPLVDEMINRVGTKPDSPVLDRAFVAGDSIILVFRNSARLSKVCFVAFDVYDETWQIIFTEGDSEELAEFDGFFEVRADLRLPHDIREGMKVATYNDRCTVPGLR